MNKYLLTLVFIMCSVVEVQVRAAEEAVVIEVKKNLSLGKTDKIYRNFVINGGSNVGLSKGAIVDVLRRVAVHDPLKNASIGDIRVKVAELEIIHADPKISVARLVSQESPENRPVLDIEAIMIGDRLDLKSIRSLQTASLDKEALLGSDPQAKVKNKDGTRGIASIKKSGKKSGKKAAQ